MLTDRYELGLSTTSSAARTDTRLALRPLTPLLGAAVFVVLQDYVSSVTTNWMSFVGMLFILVVLFFPRGLLGFVQNRGQRDTAPG